MSKNSVYKPENFKDRIQALKDKLKQEEYDYLHSIYTDPSHPAAFAGVQVLYDYVKTHPSKFHFTKNDVLQYLESQPIYTERVPKKRPAHYPRLIVAGPNSLFEMDVAYMPTAPGGKKFLLTAIDTFSKRVKTAALSSLKSKFSTPAAMQLIDDLGSTTHLRTDQGVEFLNRDFRQALEKRGIHHYLARSANKAVNAERFFRSFKPVLLRAAQKLKKSWVKLLPELTEAYNNRKHRTLNDTPNEIATNQRKAADLWFDLRERAMRNMPKDKPYRYEINQPVRIRIIKKSPFQKESALQFSEEVYFIAGRHKQENVHLYRVKTQENFLLPQKFLESQMQKVHLPHHRDFKVAEVTGRKIVDGTPSLRIKWDGFSPQFDTYLPSQYIKGEHLNEDLDLLSKDKGGVI